MPTILEEKGGLGPTPGTPFVVCFPSAGLASTIVGHYVIQQLKIPRVATVRSALLPPAAVVIDRRPNAPVRIHANRTVAIAVSEFPPPSALLLPLTDLFAQYVAQHQLSSTIVVEGVLQRSETPSPSDGEEIMGIAANDAAEASLARAKVPILSEGIVGGLSAEMLNQAAVLDRAVSVLFAATTQPDLPDYRAASRLLEILDRLVPGLSLNPAPMMEQAEVLEKALKQAMKLHDAAKGKSTEEETPAPPIEPSMYG